MVIHPTNFRILGNPSVNAIAALSLCKQALRVDHDEEDELINVYRAASKHLIEGLIDRSLDNLRHEVIYELPMGLEDYHEFWLPVGPLDPTADITIGDETLRPSTRDYLNFFIRGSDLTALSGFSYSDSLTLNVRTYWDFEVRNADIVHTYLSLVAEQYRRREVFHNQGAVSAVIKQSLYKYRRAF